MAPLEVALAGRWEEWDGLEPDAAAPPGVRAWERDGRLVLVALDDPPAPRGLPAALAAPGPPDRVQPARHELLGAETEEHVFCGRGLVLVVATPYDHAPAAARGPWLARAELFAPCSLAEWEVELAPLSRPRRPWRATGP